MQTGEGLHTSLNALVQTEGEGEAFFQIFQTIRFAANGTRERERGAKLGKEFWKEREKGDARNSNSSGRDEMEVQVFFLRRNTLLLLVPPLVMENPPDHPKELIRG